ncbi:hypothetical protein COLO4_20181 [Corchorus olitorius]|uniref:Uncharacterized protein n=1 Tax=Corchorus olitorius TaxID=93759 RepID=A0A1R3J1A6_9ROSI|nr:hypothetical protein COLO4_20181 [Corchorus olitorius]
MAIWMTGWRKRGRIVANGQELSATPPPTVKWNTSKVDQFGGT